MGEPLDYVMKASDVLFSLLPSPMPSEKQVKDSRIVAHRGAHSKTIKENTMEAFQKCRDHGVWGIEFDIRWTKDLVPVIHHDATTERVFQKKIVISEIEFNELREEVPEVPSLQELVDEFKKEVHYMLEIKEDASFSGKSFQEKVAQFRKITDIFNGFTAVEDFHIISLSPSLFNYFKDIPKKSFLPIAELNERTLVEQSIDQDWGGFTGHYLTLLPDLRRKLQINAKPVGVGFVDSFSLLKRELYKGTRWIFTNNSVYISECRDQLLSVFHK